MDASAGAQAPLSSCTPPTPTHPPRPLAFLSVTEDKLERNTLLSTQKHGASQQQKD